MKSRKNIVQVTGCSAKGQNLSDMLLADKLDIEQKLKVNMLSIELRELDFYRVNCNTIGTQAALLCGFAFTGIVEAPWDYLLIVDGLNEDSISTVSNGGRSTGSGVAPGFGLKFATVLFFLLGMLSQLMCVVKAMQISILAPGLAIRGPEGSMGKALQAMRLELKRLRWQFQIGVLFYFIGTDLFIWSIFDWVTALVATIILVSALVWIVIDSIKIAERLRLPQAANLWTHAVDRHAAADQACFSCTGAYVTKESESVPHVHVQFDPHAKVKRQSPAEPDREGVSLLIGRTHSRWIRAPAPPKHAGSALKDLLKHSSYLLPGGGHQGAPSSAEPSERQAAPRAASGRPALRRVSRDRPTAKLARQHTSQSLIAAAAKGHARGPAPSDDHRRVQLDAWRSLSGELSDHALPRTPVPFCGPPATRSDVGDSAPPPSATQAAAGEASLMQQAFSRIGTFLSSIDQPIRDAKSDGR